MDLALNNIQRLICRKTQQTKPNQTKKTSKLLNQAIYLMSIILSTESDTHR